MTDLMIERSELVRIVDRASEHGCAASTREKLRAIAETTDAVAVGWYHCDGTGCPARQAGRRNMFFQTAFDRAMAARFGRDFENTRIEPFVVTVAGRAA